MDKIVINESKMKFGEFDCNAVFQIEKSMQYAQSLRSNGIKTCEFVLLKGNKLLFVEAKERCPNYFKAQSSNDKKQKYDEYVDEITEKMKHSLFLYSNILLGRYEKDGMSERMLEAEFKKLDIRLVLVVKKAEKQWLEPFSDVFRSRLDKEMRIWKIQTFSVINEEMARMKRLVV